MHIRTENPLVRSPIEFIARTVLEHGGLIHPDLRITQQDERLWISCGGAADGSALLVVPDELFIPVTHLEWSGENGVLRYAGDTSRLSPIQQELLDAMVEVYNATDKIPQVAEHFPAQLLPGDPELLAWLTDARPAFVLPKTAPARQFIDTRLYEKTAEDGQVTGYLMPLIDLLNHHPYGPKYQSADQNSWRIPVEKPNPHSDECFVRYSKSDSLSVAMWHAYFEPNTRYLASVDCTLVHAELGEIRIKGTNAKRRKINAPCLVPGEHVLTFQDLVLEQEQLHALRTLLGLAVRSKRRDLAQTEAEVVADELIQLLVEANIRKYAELLELCRADAGHFPLRPLFGQVAEHQLALLGALRAA